MTKAGKFSTLKNVVVSALRLGGRRTAGIVVSATVHRVIVAANRERDQGHWRRAAALYAEALACRPDLAHLHVQHGHALKEIGEWEASGAAYRSALAAGADMRDTWLSLAHLLKIQGAQREATETFVALVLADPDDAETMREARETLGFIDAAARRLLVSAILSRLGRPTLQGGEGVAATQVAATIFDVCDLIRYFSHSRRPTGIQRVQIETLTALLTGAECHDGRVILCCFIQGRDEWVAVSSQQFLTLASLSGSEAIDELEWRRARDRFHLGLLIADPLRFPVHCTLVNLGASWSIPNYFLRLRDERKRARVDYIPLVHDLIPVLFPEYFEGGLVEEFATWIGSVLCHASAFLAVSQSTRCDLLRVARRLNYRLGEDDIEVISLEANCALATDSRPFAALPFEHSSYVLFVATIEPRKGHLVAFDAWSVLIDRLGIEAIPHLVCVGRDGWRNDAIFSRLESDALLASRVIFLKGLDDHDLAKMYKGSCFTIFPSLYEGWGLPVTESLSYGKVVITTTSSSLPEAGGRFAIYIAPGDHHALADEVERLIRNPMVLAERETELARSFRIGSWGEVANRINQAVGYLSARPSFASDDDPCVLASSDTRSMARSGTLRPADQTGEPFRAGRGWRDPDAEGCRIKGTGELAFRIANEMVIADGRAVLLLTLMGGKTGARRFRVATETTSIAGTLTVEERRTVKLEVSVPADRVVSTIIEDKGAAVECDGATGSGSLIDDAIGVAAFAMRPHSDNVSTRWHKGTPS